ncbi:ABC transporter permease [Dactylosporangium matsuzakiense]|uniref:Transport permease protein n=1 Tax=Dactylosporangium matsuzakiense TaxID=53360 RepID=A0A9W6KUJ1_9ACTN|nr:ABC transporter permease [Dactylosporangium matsuzakiense]UWZ46527.1 ABC transporter permease [Dactylosporangium matsuzakiense]GLL06665.1 transport permease protein [Dactylosporangium matsuzakiense]
MSSTALTQWTVLSGRALRLGRRNVEALIMSIALPVMLMIVFVYLFGGAIQTGTEYVTYVVPGVMLLCVSFGSAMTAVSVANDLKEGIVDRLRTLDVGGAAVISGHVFASLARNVVSSALVLGVAFALGFRPHAHAGQWLAALGILVLTIAAVSWLSACMGLLAGTPEAASGYTFSITFLPYASSAFVPIDTMPSWLRGFAGNQPVTPITESLRGLLLDQPVGTAPWRAVAWCAGIMLVSILAAALLFRTKTRT